MLAWPPQPMDPVQLEPIDEAVVSFIGDVHGWWSRLEDLLPQCQGHLVFVGDLIDRGSQSREVVQAVRALVEEGRASVIMGNHEYALVRGLGCPDIGIPGNDELYEAWWSRYGGATTAHSYGADPQDPQALRRALGDDLAFLAELPWYLWGRAGDQPWLAVHAGLEERPYAQQLHECSRQYRWLRTELPRFLYAKDRVHTRPSDLPTECALVSGHTPQPEASITAGRILTDTSGGRFQRRLSAVIWPSGEVVQSQDDGSRRIERLW
ncbi:MAG: hypothetical protein EA401_00045 [Planctomycetota bacterium]|nr:MAG: hypothetical protein EA401_00045 [Planctomycetota bacterium]